MPYDAIVIDERDNVATAIRELPAGERVLAERGGTRVETRVSEAIPTGHKFALTDIARESEIIKYGEVIGRATTSIRKGDLVHVHNVEGLKGRGDRS